MSLQGEREKRQTRLDGAFKAVLSTPDGRLVVANLMLNCGLYHPSPDLGKRSVALGLREKAIRLDPKLWSALDAEILALRIDPQTSPKESEDE